MKEQHSVGYNALHRQHDQVDILGNAGWTTSSKPYRKTRIEPAELFLDRCEWRHFIADRS